MPTEDNKITLFSGDDRTISLSVNKSNVSPQSVAGAKIWLTAKSDVAVADSGALLQKRNTAAGGSDSEILVTDAANGQIQIFLVPADTESAAAAIYAYDVQVVLSSGKKHTIVRSRLVIEEDVTKTVS